MSELEHHGILGMKWGVRRYQNKDGTLTPRGQKRYNKEMAKLKEEERVLKNRAKAQAKIDKLTSKKQEVENLRKSLDKKPDSEFNEKHNISVRKKRTLKELSDDELRARINRLNMEKQYRDLMAAEKANIEKGKSYTKEVLSDAGKKILVENAVDVGKQVSKYFMVKFANKKLGEDAIFTNNKKKS